MKLILDFVVMYCISLFLIIPASSTELIGTEKLYIEYLRTMSERDYRLPEDKSTVQRLNLGLKLDLGKGVYIDNRVVSGIDESQFRLVGLESDIGVNVYKGIDLFYRHASYHVLDMGRDMKYPTYNGFGIRINLIK